MEWHRAAKAATFSISVATAACGTRALPSEGRSPTPVRIKMVEPRSDSSATRYSGAISPATQVDLAFRASGYVQALLQVKDSGVKRNVQEGDSVKHGDVLAIVRPADLEQKRAAANASTAQAVANEKQAQLEYDRTRALYERNGVAKADLDNASIRLESAHAQVAGARAQAGQAALALDDTRLVSPIDGLVMKRNIEVGTLVSPSGTAFVVADTTSVKVVFGAPDALAAKLKIGGQITVSVGANPGDLEARVTRIAPSADPNARVFDVEARLPNPDGSLKSGMIASLSVPEATLAPTATMMPLTAVIRSPHNPRGFATFVVDGVDDRTTAHLRDVQLGDVYGNDVVAIGGLAIGDRVVSQGATIVTDGAAVRVVP